MDCSLELQSVRGVPGIGGAYAAHLATHGYTHASQLYMLFIDCQGNQEQFVVRLKQLTEGGSESHMIMAYNFFFDWYRQHGNMPIQ